MGLYSRNLLYALYGTQLLDQCIRLAEAYYNRGIARAKSGNKQAGIQDLSKAGELGLYDAYSVIKRLNKAK